MGDVAATESQPRRRRLRLRFGLRTFLIVVTLVGILLGWFGRELARVRRQGEAVNQLLASGAKVYYDYQFRGTYVTMTTPPAPKVLRWLFGDELFTDVALVRWNVTSPASDKQVAWLTQLRKLENVVLAGPRITDQSIECLQGLPLLEGLAMEEVGVSPSGIRRLSEFPKLSNLVLYGSFLTDAHLKAMAHDERLIGLQLLRTPNVTDEGLSTLAELKGLKYLDLYSVPKASDSSISAIARLEHLTSLNVHGTSITDDALVDIGKLVKLERLTLNVHPITDKGLAALTALTNLRSLKLADTQISDAGLQTVGGFAALEELDLTETQITGQGFDRLSGLSKLAKLELTYNQLTDEGLLKLKDLKSQRYLSVTLGPRVSREGARRLKAFLPECQIDCYSPDGTGGAVLQATE